MEKGCIMALLWTAAVLVLFSSVAAETCIGNSTYAAWNEDNVLSALCTGAEHTVASQRNTSAVTYFRTGVELPATVNAEEAELTLTAVGMNGTVHTATASAGELIVTICFPSDEPLAAVQVNASEGYLESNYLRYAFYYDELEDSTCPDAPPNEIYNYYSPVQDNPEDDEDCFCYDHGTCSEVPGYCECDEGWFGMECQLYCTRDETCNGFGSCHKPDARCQCDDCYFGQTCEYVDPACLVLLPPLPEPTDYPDCDCTGEAVLSWRSLMFLIICIGIVVIVTAACLIYVVLKKIRRITQKKEYIPASILEEDEIEW